MNKKIPYNIRALLDETSYKNFFESTENIWPYDDINFQSFADKVLNLLIHEASNLENTYKEIILTDVYFVICLINYSHDKAIQKNHHIDKDSFNKKDPEINLKNLNLNFNQDKIVFKRFFKNFIFSKKNLKKKCKIFGSKNKFIENYIFSNQNNIDYDYAENYFNVERISSSQFNKKIENFVNSFFSKYSLLIIEYFSTEINFNLLKKVWCERINQINDFKNYFKGNLLCNNDAVYFSNAENQYHRILSLILRQDKVDTYSFDHGYDNYIKRKKTNYWFKNIYNFYVCYNKSCKNFLDEDIGLNSQYPKNLIPKFITYKNDIYINKKKKLLNKKKIKIIKNIMLIGFPMNSIRHLTEVGNFWYFKLQLEINILKSLKKENFNVIYKIHPDLIGWEKIISKYCDEIRYTHFEEKLDDIDLIIFTYTANSCLNPAICSNIPIIIFDTFLDKFNKDQFQLFNKRCKILKINFDNSGYIFEEKKLIDSVNNINPDIDNEYFEKFLV